MFLLPTVPIGILLGLLLGGRLGRLAYVRVSKPWLFYLALALQIAAFPSLFMPWRVGTQAATVLSIASYGCLVAAAFANRRLFGMPIAAAGMLLNLAAILANGGHMPALPSAMRHGGLDFSGVHNNSVREASPNLAWFVDRWAAPGWVPFGNIFSLGDVLIAVGAIVAIAAAMGARVPFRREPAVETDPA
jgi:hypothetical protein